MKYNGMKIIKAIRNGNEIRCWYNGTDVVDGIVTDGLLFWIKSRDFSNSPPTTVMKDRSGQNNDITPANFAYTTASGSDTAGGIVFDGSSDYLFSTISDKLKLTTLTVEWKGILKDLNAYRGLVEINSADFSGAIGRIMTFGTTLNFHPKYPGNPLIVDGSLVPLDTVITIAATYNSVTAVACMYINGILVGTTQTSIDPNVYIVDPNVCIGQDMRMAGRFFNGTFYESRIYGRELTGAELLKNHNATK